MTDAIVLGAGHNGLAAALRLARAGKSVVLLERRDMLGGVAALEEFHPGFRVPGIQHGTCGLRPRTVDALGLHARLAWNARAPAMLAPTESGPGLVFRPGDDAPPDGLDALASAVEDARAWTEWRAFLQVVRPIVGDLVDAPPPELRGSFFELLGAARPALALRRLGERTMAELLRAAPMSVQDHLTERFRDPLLVAFLASRGIEGGFLGPRSAGSTALLLLRECAAGPGVRGGASALTEALVAAARAAQVALETSKSVARIRVANGRVQGVELDDGSRFDAPLVVSALGVRTTLLDLVPPGGLPSDARDVALRVRARGNVAALRLALSAPPRWRGRADEAIAHARTAPDATALDRAFDCVKHRRACEAPWLDVYTASLERADLAPPGAASVSVLVHCAARDLEGGWTDERAAELGERVLDELERCAPGVRASVLGRELLTPPAIARRFALDGGHPHHADLGLDQLFLQRPAARFARYRTPIEGLWLAGRSSHPGSDFLGSSGLLAAESATARRS